MTLEERLDKATIRLARKIYNASKDEDLEPEEILDLLDRDEAFIYGVVSAVMLRDEMQSYPEDVASFFSWCYKKIQEGKDDDEIYEEVKRIRKEHKLYLNMVYGSLGG